MLSRIRRDDLSVSIAISWLVALLMGLLLTCRVDQILPTKKDQSGLSFNQPRVGLRTNRQKSVDQLQTNQHRQRDHTLHQRDIARSKNRRERRAKRDGDDEVERVHF